MAAYRKRQEGKGEKHSVAKEAIYAEIDPAEKEVRTEAKHDRGAKHVTPEVGHVAKTVIPIRAKAKAKNGRRGKKGRAQKDV